MLRGLCGLVLILGCRTESAASCAADYANILQTTPTEEVVHVQKEISTGDVGPTKYLLKTATESLTISHSVAISLPFINGTNALFARTEEVGQHLQQCLKLLEKKPPENEKSQKFWNGMIAVSKNVLDGFLGIIKYQQKLMGSVTNMVVGSNNFVSYSDKGMSFSSAFSFFQAGLDDFTKAAQDFDSNTQAFVTRLQSQIGTLFENHVGELVIETAQKSHAAKVKELQDKKIALAKAEAKYGPARQAAIAQERNKADELKMYEGMLAQTQTGHDDAVKSLARIEKDIEDARAREIRAQEEVRKETTRHRFWIFSWSTTTEDNSAAERAARRRAMAENFEQQVINNKMSLQDRVKALTNNIAELHKQYGAAKAALDLAETEYKTNVIQRAASEYKAALQELDRTEALLEAAVASTGQDAENLVSFLKEAHAITKGTIATAVVTTGIAGAITEISGALERQFSAAEEKWEDVTRSLGPFASILDARGYKQRSDCDLTPDLVASEIKEIEKEYGKALSVPQKNRLQKFLSGTAFSLPAADLAVLQQAQSNILREFAKVLMFQSNEVHKRLDQSSKTLRLAAPESS